MSPFESISNASFVLQEAEAVRVVGEFDVVVVGGGPSGVAAAIAAARSGASVALVERSSFLGGTATGAMVASFMGFFWRNRRIVGGIAMELVERILAREASPGFGRYVLAEASDAPIDVVTFPFDPEVMKIVLDEMLVQSGVQLYLHSQAVAPIIENGTCTGIVYQGIESRKALRARVVVDASANGTVAVGAGGRRENERADPRTRQPMTQIARLVDVDMPRFRSLPRAAKAQLAVEGVSLGVLSQKLLSVVSSPHGDDAIILMTRVSGRDGTDEAQLALAEVDGRRMIDGLVPFLRQSVPGFERAKLGTIASWIGVRETWRVVGKYVVTGEDIRTGRQFPDAIALGGGPLDIHHSDGVGISLTIPDSPFQIPYRALLVPGAPGVIVTGRCVSATAEGMGGMRHMGTVMALGQAAGTAAALSVALDIEPSRLDPVTLQKNLVKDGAILTLSAAAVELEVH
ncbi:MAG: FAD-dependent oxidoreductase [Rhodococcus sp. (in: high G+C Gram-positive bacteria)]|nr:MAG: FAD-dependent oxidoreductase [Rhodococcus sp. (in: high G+C Gram-positive bacteria)]